MPTDPVIRDCPHGERPTLEPLIDECFEGIYRWHALRTLARVSLVRVAEAAAEPVGLTMLTVLAPGTAYLYYIAVRPTLRRAGLGRSLLQDAFSVMGAGGATEMLSAAKRDNAPSIGLLTSCGFGPTSFRAAARERGLLAAAGLWRRMVVAPGEAVFRRPL